MSELKKYEILRDKPLHILGISGESVTLYRIRALRDFSHIKAGTIGGYVAGGHNLDHRGNAWVADDAVLMGNSFATGNSLVTGRAMLTGNVRVSGNAWVGDKAILDGNVILGGDEKVFHGYHDRVYLDDKRAASGNAQIHYGRLTLGTYDGSTKPSRPGASVSTPKPPGHKAG